MNSLRALAQPQDQSQLDSQIASYLDTHFPTIASTQQSSSQYSRSLDDDILFWEAESSSAHQELEETSKILPGLIHDTQTKLQQFLSDAQSLSLQRYDLADQLATLLSELSSDVPTVNDQGDHKEEENGWAEDKVLRREKAHQTVLEDLERLQGEMDSLGAALAWVAVYENILALSEKTLDPKSHSPSPLAAIPDFQALNDAVNSLSSILPTGTSLLSVVQFTRDSVWTNLKEIMSANLTRAAEAIGWPMRVTYEEVEVDKRRAFERSFVDLVLLQNEGERLGVISSEGLYPLQALVQPIALRFKYHFQGSRSTNRVDKPEWAFAHVLDQMYQHQSFLDDYIGPLTVKGGRDIDIKSEFAMLLFPILLSLLRSRIPYLLPHPALLAHTIYQAVLFDDAVRERGFDSTQTSCPASSWEGLAGTVLRQEGWFDHWLSGEKKFAESQLNEIISSPKAWTLLEPESPSALFSTESARQIKSLFEQITDRYTPLAIEYKLPFIASVQLPLLEAYRVRIAGSLEAFETLSSAFVRSVPGALGSARSLENARVTGGVAGLQRLLKTHVSASFVVSALRSWADSIMFVETSGEISANPLLVSRLALPVPPLGSSILDEAITRFSSLAIRAEDMIVRHIAVEVESDLKQHLTRRWDIEDVTSATSFSPTTTNHDALYDDNIDTEDRADASLVAALTTFSTLISTLFSSSTSVVGTRVYRRAATQIAAHITQRTVFAGWSKFTAAGGRKLKREIEDWQATAQSAADTAIAARQIEGGGEEVSEGSSWAVIRLPRSPWSKLVDMATVLALPTESQMTGSRTRGRQEDESVDLPTFSQAMAAAWTGGESLIEFCQRLGIDMSDVELQAVLRRRTECWR